MVAELNEQSNKETWPIDAPTADELTAEESKKKQAALQTLIVRGETLAHRGAWMVFAGLALDILIVCLEHRSGWNMASQILADALIALGVLLELHYGRKASQAQHELQRAANLHVAQANQLAQEARERAALIEKTYSWRRVSKELRERLVRAVGSMTGESLIVKIDYQNSDPEAHRFANDIGLALTDAGVPHENLSLAPNSFLFQSIYGLCAAPAAELDAEELFTAFKECGMPVTRSEVNLADPARRVNGVVPTLYVFVGMKPWLSSLEHNTGSSDPEAPAY